MKYYRFYVMNEYGKKKKGQVQADSWEHAREILRAGGDMVLELEQVGVLESDLSLSFFEKKISLKDMSIFCHQFQVMEESGISILQILDQIKRQNGNPLLIKAIEDVQIRIERGESFCDALERQNRVFSGFFCNMVRAGEKSGRLEMTMGYLTRYYEKTAAIRNAIVKAMVYPVILMITTLVIFIIMLVYMVPLFTEMFEQTGTQLSGMTQIVVIMSKTLKEYGVLVGVAFFLMNGAVLFCFHTGAGRMKMESVLLQLPWIGTRIRKIYCARMARYLSMMLGTGITFADTLKETAAVIGSPVYCTQLEKVCNHIKEGRKVSSTLADCDLFLPTLVQMIATGEESGQLDKLLERTAIYYEDEIFSEMDQISVVIEPVMIMIIAALVLVIISAVIDPMLSMYSMIDGI